MQTIQIKDKQFQSFISAQEIQQRIAEIQQQLTGLFKEKKPLFVVVLRGAFIFASDLLKQYNSPCDIEFVKLSSYDGMQSSGKIKIDLPLDEIKIKGRDIIVLEDIVDSGLTMSFFKNYLQSHAVNSITLVSFLFKPESLKREINIDIIGFSIPNLFVIGYGLDYNGEGRNLPAVYQIVE